jgi:hypothetical protein
MQGFRVKPFLLVYVSMLSLLAGDPVWNAKPAAQWTAEDARQVLFASPWAKEVKASIARRLGEDELRDGGGMGQPHGVGYDGIDPPGKGPKMPARPSDVPRTVTLRLRWESALPVRIAELKSGEMEAPTLEGDGYRIAVYGVPGGGIQGDPKQLGDPLRQDAVLRREGKNDVKPSMVEVFQREDGLAVVYRFPLSAEITRKDGRVRFEARIGRIALAQTFELAGMQFQGKLEL